jgi:hypothetical protein
MVYSASSGSLLVIVSVAVLLPLLSGLNVTVNVWDDPGTMGEAGWLVTENTAPATCTFSGLPVNKRSAEPKLLMTKVTDFDVPGLTFLKS